MHPETFRYLSGAVAVDIVASGNVWIRVYDSNGNAAGISITQEQWEDLKKVSPVVNLHNE